MFFQQSFVGSSGLVEKMLWHYLAKQLSGWLEPDGEDTDLTQLRMYEDEVALMDMRCWTGQTLISTGNLGSCGGVEGSPVCVLAWMFVSDQLLSVRILAHGTLKYLQQHTHLLPCNWSINSKAAHQRNTSKWLDCVPFVVYAPLLSHLNPQLKTPVLCIIAAVSHLTPNWLPECRRVNYNSTNLHGEPVTSLVVSIKLQ